MMQDREILFRRVPREEMPEFLQVAYDRAEEIGDTGFQEACANAPEIMHWFHEDFYEKLFFRGRVSQRLKELVRARLSRSNGCAVCSVWNAGDMLEIGYTAEQIDAVTAWPDPVSDLTVFSGEELAVLKYTDQMVLANMDAALTPELYKELRQYFTDGDLIELGVVMAVFTGMAKFTFIADLMPKLHSCPIPGNTGVGTSLKIEPARSLSTAAH